MNSTDNLNRRVAEAAMRVAARKGWRGTDPVAVAREAEVPLEVFYRQWPDRVDLLAAVSRVVDETVLAGGAATDGETARDRLFDILMRRFDALKPFREGLRSVVRDLPFEPLTAAAFARHYARSMSWMLRAAGIGAESGLGRARAAALGALHIKVLRVWLADDSPDLARTMAALDSALRQAESWSAPWRSCGPKPTAAGA